MLELVFFIQVVGIIFLLIILQKMIQTKTQIDEITEQVKKYIQVVTEDLEEQQALAKEEPVQKKSKLLQEEQNQLIQTVLGEYFP